MSLSTTEDTGDTEAKPFGQIVLNLLSFVSSVVGSFVHRPGPLRPPCFACRGPGNSRIVSIITLSDPDFTHDVFLSHSSKDATVVRAVGERLRAAGLRVWLDGWEIRPGDSIPAKIEDGLEHSRVLVFCMSAHAFGSDWAQLES